MSRSYSSVDIKQACDGADLAIACLGTGGMAIVTYTPNVNHYYVCGCREYS